ncbi:unnamed protein product [Rotaria magnacalcarata]|uniref:Uncharacterized protein n=1 Tax=Rotaria magnacalcarata TaxID=392030 RepID=A0A816NUL0_9BILA|nr:unnamed protein product [Rotaria magnacalcarata]CAF2019224.1 unnamed protein product [Rotaria magnacalcarata]CAF2040312.1 unnamed protein product [Rotaria magnacalcarata]CAF2077515.1 unnamed protein product [Rotaria magnacalcarata]CAF4010641.1 unnamed protein product [Rotaria magnacalcarata]
MPSNNTNKPFIFLQKKQTPPSFLVNLALSDSPIRVDSFVMTRCPEARNCKLLFTPPLLKSSSIVNFTVSYTVHETKSNEFERMHVPCECLCNKQQLYILNVFTNIINQISSMPIKIS